MTSGLESSPPRSGIKPILPWILGIAGLAVYLVTLNHWVSLLSVPYAVKLQGWNWQPETIQPAYFLVTYPFRLLPSALIPIALNIFSAVCGGLTLALLARSVLILPHDRTQDQRDRESNPFGQLTIPLAWLPPVIAVVACGLQLTFWEHGTNGTPEMFDLLLFSFVIRSLLEYRLHERESQLYAAAFVQGIGMANNFAMIGFFPLLIAALVWLRGFSFFNVRFLSRIVMWGLLGLSLYLLLPVVNALAKDGAAGGWNGLRANLSFQRQLLSLFVFSKGKLIHGIRMDDSDPLWILGVTSLMPLFLMAIRWPSHFGDTSRLGTLLAKWIFHIAHAFLLILCVWVIFDSPISPRSIFTKHELQSVLPLLTFYYLSALAIGYFAGYFLLVFRPIVTRSRRATPLATGSHRLATISVIAALSALIAGLLYRNGPSIRATNGSMLKNFATAMAEGLPQRGILLSDDPRRLSLMQAFLATTGRQRDFLTLETHALRLPAYHDYLRRRYPTQWSAHKLEPNLPDLYDEDQMVQTLVEIAAGTEIFYLHPSFGLIFEYFADEPHCLTQRLRLYAPDSLLAAPLSDQLITENEAFWSGMENRGIKPLMPDVTEGTTPRKTGVIDKLFLKIHLPLEKNAQSKSLAAMYSQALNYWAVQLQKANQWEKALPRLESALRLDSNNLVAKLNAEYNKQFQEGKRGAVGMFKSVEELYGRYRTWDRAVAEFGPYDEPRIVYGQAYLFLRNRQFRQAGKYFERLRTLFRDDVASRLWLGNLYLMYGQPKEALAIVHEIRSLPNISGIEVTNAADLLSVEAGAYFAKNEPSVATDVIATQLKRHTNDVRVTAAAIKLYSDNGRLTNAYEILEKQLKASPNDPLLLINKGILLIGETNYSEAIGIFDHVISVHTNVPTARLYRAITYIKMRDLNKAKQDYEAIVQTYPNLREALFGLHDIAFEQNEKMAALEYGKRYLSNAIPAAPETKLVVTRVRSLEDETSGKGNSNQKVKPSPP